MRAVYGDDSSSFGATPRISYDVHFSYMFGISLSLPCLRVRFPRSPLPPSSFLATVSNASFGMSARVIYVSQSHPL